MFPLFDAVSVVGFECRVGSRLLHSKVKSKEQAQSDYQNAIENQQTAAIMDHSNTQNDVFLIRLGNVPAKETITVDITYVGELKQDSQTDGIRYTLPNSIAPRYGSHVDAYTPGHRLSLPADIKGISLTVDVIMEKDSILRELQSPSHSIKVSLGRSSLSTDSTSFDPSKASATMRLVKGEYAELERDFVLVVKADGLDNPRALLETHPVLPGQRAIMAMLVPKFSVPPAQPEVVFVIDRSGSMADKISTLQAALRIFLKSLPVGICFNICSFGSSYSFLWPTSRVYDASSLNDAMKFVSTINANMGGTEMQSAVVATVQNRLKNKDLEVLLLTDGEIWNQQELFDFVRASAADNSARFFSLAIGDAASHSLVEGVARAGNGFSQSVIEYEELDRKVVRMLKGALTPHIFDYSLDVQYDGKSDDDFEVLDHDESLSDSATEVGVETPRATKQATTQQPISLFDANFKGSDAELGSNPQTDDKSLPSISPPRELQAPHKIPPLYPFIRTTVYLLLDPRSSHRTPRSLTFRAISKQGPLVLQIPITDSGKGETIHQLASRKAVIELEENHGWLQDTRDKAGNPFSQFHADTQQRLAARECQSLGIKYQVTGKYCSFVALESDVSSTSKEKQSSKEIEAQTVPSQTFGHPRVLIAQSAGFQSALHRLPTAAASLACFGSMQPTSASSQFQPSPLFSSAQVVPTGGRTGAMPLYGVNRAMQPSMACAARQAPPPPPPVSQGRLFGGFASRPAPFQPSPSAQASSAPLFGAPPPPPPPGGFSGASFDRLQTPEKSSVFGAPAPGGDFCSEAQPTTSGFGFGSLNPFSNPFKKAAAAPPATTRRKKASLFAGQESDDGADSSFSSSPVHVLVELQSFGGNWAWTQALFDVLGCDMAGTQARVLSLLQVEKLGAEAENAVATLLALGFLMNKNADSKSLWELVYEKAEAWISNTLPQIGVVGQAIETHKNDIMVLA